MRRKLLHLNKHIKRRDENVNRLVVAVRQRLARLDRNNRVYGLTALGISRDLRPIAAGRVPCAYKQRCKNQRINRRNRPADDPMKVQLRAGNCMPLRGKTTEN